MGYSGSQSSTADMVINSEGNVGIGVANPQTNLHIESSGDTGLDIYGGDTNSPYIFIGEHVSSYSRKWGMKMNYYGNSNVEWFNMAVVDDNTEINALTFRRNGNVGIGKTDPGTALDVNGVIKSNVPSWNMWDTGTISSGILNFTTNYVPAQNCTVTLSTGRVTATVAGRYFASFHGFTESSVTVGTGCQIQIRKNGASVVRNYHYQPVSNYSALGGITVIMDLAVNDYVDVSTNFAVHHANGAGFCGFMIG
jgi:hypothetical protein